jgi:uncharacterized repeat protein (TIGR01451 family)
MIRFFSPLNALIVMGVSLMAPVAWAQTGPGAVIFSEDFGTGTFPTGQPLAPGVTNFTFSEPAQPANFDPNLPNNGIVNDGFYTIGTNTQQAFSNWADIEDNTPGDVNGLMLIVNARENELVNGQVVEDEFYRRVVTLSPNTNFNFISFLTPTNSVGDEQFCRENAGGLILPNVRFSVEDINGNVLAETTTGEIPFNPNPSFQQFSLDFSSAADSPDVQIVLSNIAPGGCGNDIAIDDITFRIAITANAEDDSGLVDDVSLAVTEVFNVVDNDSLDGNPFPPPDAPGSNTTLVVGLDTPVPPELTFDLTTGQVGTVQNASNGIFSFEYLICETAALVNCDQAVAEVTITAITIDAVNDSGTVTDTSTAMPDGFNVLDNDTLRGGPVTSFALSLAPGETLPAGVTFDLATGEVGTVAAAPNGTFSFDYQLCETAQELNCDIATATIIVDGPELPPGIGICPAGQVAITQNGFAVDAIRSNNNNVSGNSDPEGIGPILPSGTGGLQQNNPNDGVIITFFPAVDLDMTGADGVVLPENSVVTLSMAPFFNNDAQANILTSVNGQDFTAIQPVGFGQNAGPPFNVRNTTARLDITVPAGGARYIRVDQLSGGFFVDGAQRSEICQVQNLGPQLAAVKTVEDVTAGQYSVPGSDVIYTISVENIGQNNSDDDTIFLVDALPSEVTFLNVPFQDGGGNTSPNSVFFQQSGGAALDFDFTRDIGFSVGPTPPTSLNQCNAALTAGENPDVKFICFNPKGALIAGDPNPSFDFKFTTRIR